MRTMARHYVTTDGQRYESLNDLMSPDHVIRVHADGTISEPDNVHAPEIYHVPGGGVSIDGVELGFRQGFNPERDGWSLMNGYSGQDRYAGPVMHSSEFIGGRMERDIIEEPGLYVAVVVEVIDCDDDCDDDCDGEHEPAGWVVAFQALEE